MMQRISITDTSIELKCMKLFGSYCQSVSYEALMHLGLGHAPALFLDKYAKLN